MPTFHWLTRGGLKSNAVGFIAERRVGIATGRRQILQLPPGQRGVQHARRVGDHVEHHVPLRAVVEDPEAAADDRLAFPRQVVDRADARRDPEGVAILQLVVDALAGLERAVEPIRAGREPADEPRIDRVGQCRRGARRDQRGVHPSPVRVRAGRRRRCTPA